MMQYAENYRFSKKQEVTVLITAGVQVWRYSFILARSTPVWGVNALLSSSYVNAKVRWLWMAVKKIPISLAFSKMVFDDVKVVIL